MENPTNFPIRKVEGWDVGDLHDKLEIVFAIYGDIEAVDEIWYVQYLIEVEFGEVIPYSILEYVLIHRKSNEC